MTSREQQAEILRELASVIRGARNDGWTSTPILTSMAFVDALDAGAQALSPVQERVIEQERETDHGGTRLTAGDGVSILVPTDQRPHDASLPISEEDAALVLGRLLGETEILREQEQCHEDWLRVQALRLVLQRLPLPSPPEAK